MSGKLAGIGLFTLLLLSAAMPFGTASAVGVVYPAYTINNVGPKDGGGEPSIAYAPNGKLFISYPGGGGMDFYRSSDLGKTWVPGKNKADTASGDTCVATDQASSVYQCNLAGAAETAPLQADVFKSLNDGDTWTRGAAFLNGGAQVCGTSCIPFGVDRQWTSAWIPPGKTTAQAVVVLLYHDFYGPSQIWVNISTDGGATYGPPKAVMANPALTPSGLTGAGQANFYSMCDTIPASVNIERSGPHPGRIYASWIAADAAQNALGCNVSQAQAFHSLWVSWSDDGGNTWTSHLAFDGGLFHDASTPFVGFTLDNQGNPYFGFAMNLDSTPACAGGSGGSACQFNMYVVWSPDGGTTWQGGTGPTGGIPNPGTPFKVNTDNGTHFFPAIAAQNPGQVEVAYLAAEKIIATDALGKASPGGGAGAIWNLYAAQTSNLNAARPADVTWLRTKVTPVPMHVGDVCNLGIACVSELGSNRNLLDFIQVALDSAGCGHIAYTDDYRSVGIRSANQVSGCLGVATVTATSPTPLSTSPAVMPSPSPPLPNTSAGSTSGGLTILVMAALLLMVSGLAPLAWRRRPNR